MAKAVVGVMGNSLGTVGGPVEAVQLINIVESQEAEQTEESQGEGKHSGRTRYKKLDRIRTP